MATRPPLTPAHRSAAVGPMAVMAPMPVTTTGPEWWAPVISLSSGRALADGQGDALAFEALGQCQGMGDGQVASGAGDPVHGGRRAVRIGVAEVEGGRSGPVV